MNDHLVRLFDDFLRRNLLAFFPGFGRCIVYKKELSVVKQYQNGMYEIIRGRKIDATTQEPIFRHQALDEDGIVAAGMRVEQGQTMINKAVPVTPIAPLTSHGEDMHKDSPVW